MVNSSPPPKPPEAARAPVEPETLASDSGDALSPLARTQVSTLRPVRPDPKDFVELLGDIDPAEWDPLLQADTVGPLTDAGYETHGPGSIVLGEYRLVRKLGLGGFGAVYLAQQVEGDCEVALKVLSRSMAMRPDFLQRFYREARTLARLEHPHIVRGYEPFEARGWHCFAMEFIDGDSMQTWLRRLGKLNVGDAVHLALCVADGLQYAHELGLVHRDIKPENILLTRRGQVKVADLGLAKAVDEDLSLTRSGTGFGTPYYMAPEQARNAKHADLRSDIYALGTTIYHLLAGQLPFKGETALELILAKEQAPLPPIRKLNDEVPEQLDLIVYKMLAKNINHRYQTCAELIRDLQRLQLAHERLSFIGTVDGVNEDDEPQPPLAVTRAVVIASRQPDAAVDEQQAERWWEVRYRNSQGERVVRRMTTRQLQEQIKDERFDMQAEVRPELESDYQPVVFFAEFQGSMLKRQSHVTKTSISDSSVKLQRLYQQAETRRAFELEQQRQSQAEERRLQDLAEEAEDHGLFRSLRTFWHTHGSTKAGRLITGLVGLLLSGLLIWIAIRVVGLLTH